MAENYRHLVQCTGRTRLDTVFNAGSNDISIIKDVIICNNDSENRKYSLAIVKVDPESDLIETISNKAYIFRDANIDAKETISISTMWCLDPGSQLKFSSDKDDSVSLNVFGITVSGE